MIALFIIIFKRFSRLIVTLVIDGNDDRPPDGGSAGWSASRQEINH